MIVFKFYLKMYNVRVIHLVTINDDYLLNSNDNDNWCKVENCRSLERKKSVNEYLLQMTMIRGCCGKDQRIRVSQSFQLSFWQFVSSARVPYFVATARKCLRKYLKNVLKLFQRSLNSNSVFSALESKSFVCAFTINYTRYY